MVAHAAWHTGTTLLRSLRDLPDRYTGVLLDQYGAQQANVLLQALHVAGPLCVQTTCTSALANYRS